jgi:hypothetical protein
MSTASQVWAEFDLAPGTHIEFAPSVEVMLDCSQCHKPHRTVVFAADTVYCTPTGHAYRGRLDSIQVDGSRVTYHLSHEESPAPAWARITFHLTCPRCDTRGKFSTQTNEIRPLEGECRCGQVLYAEHSEQPHVRAS